MEIEWTAPPARPAFPSEQLHVWRGWMSPLPADFDRLAASMSAEERARAERFRFERHRDRFIAARGMLRSILACYLQCDAERIEFDYGQHGKPELAEVLNPDGYRFNVSHSGDLALFGVTRQRIGVDVERLREVPNALALAERFFSRGEAALVRETTGEQRMECFLRLWTRKEAVIKAIGTGLAMPLDRFDVAWPTQCSTAMLHVETPAGEKLSWSVTDLNPAPGYLGAVAVEGSEIPLIRWHREA